LGMGHHCHVMTRGFHASAKKKRPFSFLRSGLVCFYVKNRDINDSPLLLSSLFFSFRHIPDLY
jgi:hypothetical protein